MYDEGRTYREITKEVHMSPGDISSIIKRHTGEPEKGEQQQQEVTIHTKVFKLFEEGKSPVQVAIDLNLPSTEVTRLQSEYRRLIGLQELNQLQEEIGLDIFEFSRTYKFTKSHGYTPRQLIDAADHLDELPLLRSEREQLVQESQYLETQKQNKTIKLEQVERSIVTAQQNLDSVNTSIRAKKEELELLNRRKQQVQMVIASIITSAGYQNIERIADSSVRSVLNQNQVVLTTACRAIFQALKEEPRDQLEFLIQGSLSYPFYEPGTGRMPQNYLQHRQAVLVYAAEETYRNLLAKVLTTTMSSAINAQPGSGYPL